MRIKHFNKDNDVIGIVIEDENGISQIYLKQYTADLSHVGTSDKQFDDITEKDIDSYIVDNKFLFKCITDDDVPDYMSDCFDDMEIDVKAPSVGEYCNDEEKKEVEKIKSEWRQLHENVRRSETVFRQQIENQARNFSERAKYELSDILDPVIVVDVCD